MQIQIFGKTISAEDRQVVLTQTKTITLQQIHSNTVTILTDPDHQTVLRSDAVISPFPDTTLIIKHADCLPVFIVDENTGISAAIHAGRKGTDLEIVTKTIQTLIPMLKQKPKLQILFGPAICEPCYQINSEQNLHYNLIDKNQKQIEELLEPEMYTLTLDRRCTVCNNDELFSYRKDGKGVAMNYSILNVDEKT